VQMKDGHGDIVENLARLGSATIAESGGNPLDPGLRPIWPSARVSGPAYPVLCAPGDNLAIHVAVIEAPPGSVLAVTVGDLPARGYWGEVLTVAAVRARVAGLVLDGCVRDIESFERHRFPVFARGTALRGTTKDRGGSVGSPVTVGGVLVRAGDWLVGDADGVSLIESGQIQSVIGAGGARAAREQRYFEALERGATTLELLSLDPGAVAIKPD
jgi:4-hydroxy-4-methyl-2-oxoglutarate aldolase